MQRKQYEEERTAEAKRAEGIGHVTSPTEQQARCYEQRRLLHCCQTRNDAGNTNHQELIDRSIQRELQGLLWSPNDQGTNNLEAAKTLHWFSEGLKAIATERQIEVNKRQQFLKLKDINRF